MQVLEFIGCFFSSVDTEPTPPSLNLVPLCIVMSRKLRSVLDFSKVYFKLGWKTFSLSRNSGNRSPNPGPHDEDFVYELEPEKGLDGTPSLSLWQELILYASHEYVGKCRGTPCTHGHTWYLSVSLAIKFEMVVTQDYLKQVQATRSGMWLGSGVL